MKSRDTKTDSELLLESQEDPNAFREIYDRHAEPMLAYFYRRTLDPHAAADLMAETFAVAFEKRHRYSDLGRPGVSWLYGIARRELSRYRRRRGIETRALQRLGVKVPLLDDDSIERIEALVDIENYRAALVDALQHLSGRQREAVQLRVLHDLDYKAIGMRLGCSEGAARVTVHRALTRLADVLESAT